MEMSNQTRKASISIYRHDFDSHIVSFHNSRREFGPASLMACVTHQLALEGSFRLFMS